MRRRDLLQGVAAATALLAPSQRGYAAPVDASPLIYVSPLCTDGSLSRCQAEVWFAVHDRALHVVTASDAWRAEAVRSGLTAAQVWIGDVGPWRRADGAHRSLPHMRAQSALVTDPAVQTAVLQQFASKYVAEWDTWGPRFRRGLEDGSRVMLRYWHTEV